LKVASLVSQAEPFATLIVATRAAIASTAVLGRLPGGNCAGTSIAYV